ncbi:MAG TPA: hypothetical protein VF988_12470, partial [Verrucomicrobiae bacterium]
MIVLKQKTREACWDHPNAAMAFLTRPYFMTVTYIGHMNDSFSEFRGFRFDSGLQPDKPILLHFNQSCS